MIRVRRGGIMRTGGQIVLIVAVVLGAVFYGIDCFPSAVENPAVSIQVPELAGDTPPLSLKGNVSFANAKSVLFDWFEGKTASEVTKVTNQRGEIARVFLIGTEINEEDPGQIKAVVAEKEVADVGSVYKVDRIEWSSDGTLDIYASKNVVNLSIGYLGLTALSVVGMIFLPSVWRSVCDWSSKRS